MSKTLTLNYQVQYEHKVPVDESYQGVTYAIEAALRNSGLTTGGGEKVIPESIRFTVEED